MIKTEYVAECKGAARFGTCVSCGKNSHEDMKMVRYIFVQDPASGQHRTSICLCDECKQKLYQKM